MRNLHTGNPRPRRGPNPWRNRGSHHVQCPDAVRCSRCLARHLGLPRHRPRSLFFPIGTTGPAIEQIESAKAVCDTCDVKAMCLDFALTTNQDSGIWGGTSEEERRKIRRQWLAARRRAS